MNGLVRRRTAAVMEVLGVYAAGGFVADLLVRSSGVSVTNPLANLSVHITERQLITASRQMFLLLMFEYLGYFVLIVPINWWHRRRRPADYGLTKGRHSWITLLLAGLATAALSEWLVLGISLVNSIYPSQTTPWRQAFFDMSWRRWEFWLFSAVASWAVVPILEELFFRGYCQRRLAEDWGDGPAILGTACLFTFAHTQYQIGSLYNAGMIVGLLLSAIGFGLVFAWTRSLIPAILAHAVFDIPMTPAWQGILVALLLVGAVFTWRRAILLVRPLFADGSVVGYGTLTILGIAFALAAARIHHFEYAGIGLVMLALLLEAVDRRRNRTTTDTSALGSR